MRSSRRPAGRGRRAESALAALALGCAGAAGAAAPTAADWNEFGLKAAAAPGDTIVEPFFAFVLGLAEADSLGTWTGTDVAAFAAARGRASRLPVDKLVTLQRRRPAPGTQARHPGSRVLAEWTIDFVGPLSFPLPYSILGYHPGSLRLSRSLQLAELAPVDVTVDWREKRRPQQRKLDNVRVFACEKGHLLLDVDGM
ncbi:hypothetical protein FJ250_13955, partial [bacterium]|nr:hypothetical protein [bacterium]